MVTHYSVKKMRPTTVALLTTALAAAYLRLRDPKTGGDSLAEAWRIVSGKKVRQPYSYIQSDNASMAGLRSRHFFTCKRPGNRPSLHN